MVILDGLVLTSLTQNQCAFWYISGMMICILFQGSGYILTTGLFVDKGYLNWGERRSTIFWSLIHAWTNSSLAEILLLLNQGYLSSFLALIKLLLTMLLVFESPGHLSVRVHVHLVENPLSAVLCTLLIANNCCCLEIIESETNVEETKHGK